MANIGIATPDAVAAAADQLLANGQNPSVALVRDQLEGGSPNTILKHLNAWREQLGQRFLALDQSKGMPVALRESMLTLWTQALEEARSQAQADIADIRDVLEGKQSQLSQERVMLTAREQSWREETQALEQALDHARQALDESKLAHNEQMAQVRRDLKDADAHAQHHQSRVVELAAENARQHAELEALQTRLAEHREAEDQQHAADMARLDEAAQTIKQLKSNLAGETRDRQVAQKACQVAEQRRHALQQDQAVLSEKLKGLEAHQAVLVDQLTASRADLARLASKPRKRRARSSTKGKAGPSKPRKAT